MDITMYDTLLQLPLFQGLCKNDLTEIVGKVRLHFSKVKAGARIVAQGTPCNRLVFLIKGGLMSEMKDGQGLYSWNEYFDAPFVVEPYSLFGMHTDYAASYVATSDADTFSIDKNYILPELGKYPIFQLNYLNIISNRAQVFRCRLLPGNAHSLEQRVIHFFLCHSERLSGRKVLKIKMEDFAWLLNDTRLSVSKVLNELQGKHLLALRRKEIEIPDMASLMDYRESLQQGAELVQV